MQSAAADCSDRVGNQGTASDRSFSNRLAASECCGNRYAAITTEGSRTDFASASLAGCLESLLWSGDSETEAIK